MNSGENEARQPQNDRQRSRSPSGVRLRGTAEAASGRRIRQSRRSPQRVRIGGEEWNAFQEKMRAEEERRDRLSPEERLKEDGERLLRTIEADVRIMVLLQKSPNFYNARHRAGCRAYSSCLYHRPDHPSSCEIDDKYRILVDMGRSYDGKQYYHIECFLCMIDVTKPIPTTFMMYGGPENWGLMVRKWFKHGGHVDLGKIEEYMEQRDAYRKEDKEFSDAWFDWRSCHEKRETEASTCACPPEPKGPLEPVLKDYVTSEEITCDLMDVLNHPRSEEMRGALLVGMPFCRPSVLLPERFWQDLQDAII